MLILFTVYLYQQRNKQTLKTKIMKTVSITNKTTLNNNEITGDYQIIGQFCNSNDNLKMYYVVLCPDTNETHIIELHEIELSRATETF